MSDPFGTKALALLRRLTGDPESVFRDGQLDLIRSLVEDRNKTALLVQRPGWGKSAVYFIATRILRDRGACATLVISPRRALMRNQVEAAKLMGIRAATMHDANQDDWSKIKWKLKSGKIDLLLVTSQHLNVPKRRSDILTALGKWNGLLVLDEVHLITKSGYDHADHYSQVVQEFSSLPTGVRVLGCTATANNLVVADVISQMGSMSQFGSNPVLVRGPLMRDGLHLVVLRMPQEADRLEWLEDQVPMLPGTGIVFCRKVDDTKEVAERLQDNGIAAEAYWGDAESDRRIAIERALQSNELKVVVSTSALGMGFDKPDLAFVVHYESPVSPTRYYQQVGRAGRSLPESWAILLCGTEDDDIQDDLYQPRSVSRQAEMDQMYRYIHAKDCRMRLLRGFLDDPAYEPCGICDNCSNADFELFIADEHDNRALYRTIKYRYGGIPEFLAAHGYDPKSDPAIPVGIRREEGTQDPGELHGKVDIWDLPLRQRALTPGYNVWI